MVVGVAVSYLAFLFPRSAHYTTVRCSEQSWKKKKLNVFRFMFDHVMPLADAANGYELFDKMKVQKVIFRP